MNPVLLLAATLAYVALSFIFPRSCPGWMKVKWASRTLTEDYEELRRGLLSVMLMGILMVFFPLLPNRYPVMAVVIIALAFILGFLGFCVDPPSWFFNLKAARKPK